MFWFRHEHVQWLSPPDAADPARDEVSVTRVDPLHEDVEPRKTIDVL